MLTNIIKYKPLTPSLRFKCLVNKSILWSGKKIQTLHLNIQNKSGRNKNGKIVLYTRSKSYHSKIYRLINFNYSNFGIPYIINRIEYDPNRSSFINLVYYFNNVLAYFLNINSVHIGDLKFSYIKNNTNIIFNKGDNGLLKFIPENTIISINF